MSTVINPEEVTRVAANALVLPPDVNPYHWLTEAIEEEVLPHLGSSAFRGILYFCVAAHAIALIANIGTLLLRWKHKRFWLARFTSLRGRQYLTPNVATMHAITASLYCIFALIAMPQLALYTLPKLREHLILWPLLSLLTLTICCYIELFGCLASIIACNDIPSPLLRTQKPVSPLLYNIFATVIPIVYIIVTCVLIAFLDINWTRATRTAQELQGVIAGRAASWTSGRLDIRIASETMPSIDEVNKHWREIVKWIKICTIYQTIIVAALIIAWVPLAIEHVRLLGIQIHTLQNMSTSQQQSRAGGSLNTIALKKSHQSEIQNLVSLCRQRMVTAVIVVMLGLAYIALLLIPAIQGGQALLTPAFYQAFLGGLFLIYSLFGTPISLLLLRLSHHLEAGRIGSQKSTHERDLMSPPPDFGIKTSETSRPARSMSIRLQTIGKTEYQFDEEEDEKPASPYQGTPGQAV